MPMKNIKLIKAGAGSGKTYTLTDRIYRDIQSGIAPESLLATTFTVKAANELQQRIREKLLDEGRIDDAVRVSDGLIGTVNGVCGRLLSEYAIEAGLSPSLSVLSEELGDEIFAAASGSVFELYSERLSGSAGRLKMTPLRESSYGNSHDWKDDVRRILDLARSNCFSAEQLKCFAEESCAFVRSVFSGTRNLSLTEIAKRLRPVVEGNAITKGGKTVQEEVRKFIASPTTWEAAIKVCKEKVPKTDSLASCQDILEDLLDAIPDSKELLEDICAVIRGVFDCAGECIECYRARKESLGVIDFVDQETLLLDLVRKNERVRSLLRERVKKVIVDEFQDTSPIQLELFLALNELSESGSVWVGDPKQAIYGFRGSDPELLSALANSLEETESLKYSWRSKEELVHFANTVFVPTFPNMDREDVCLSVPPGQQGKANGGTIDAWHLLGKNKTDYSEALAEGVARLIREENIAPEDIAVLCRNNDDCKDLTQKLNARNIQTSSPAGKLAESRECRLAMAGFRYCADPEDSTALVSVLALSGRFPDWLNLLATGETPDKALCKLREHELFKALAEPRNASPAEILQHVIAVLDLDMLSEKSADTVRKQSNLAELRRICADYCTRKKDAHDVATASGFIKYWTDSAAPQAPGSGSNTVNVLTYHKAKGLEWPVVILSSLDSDLRGNVFGVHIRPAEEFDPKEPLKNRSISYLPWPFGRQEKIVRLESKLATNDFSQHVLTREREEQKRLMYVGLTRAKDRIVFALTRPQKGELKHKWLDGLSPDLAWRFPGNPGTETWEIAGEHFSLKTSLLATPEAPLALGTHAVFAEDTLAACELPSPAVPARLMPSGLEAVAGTATLIKSRERPCELPKCPKNKWNLLGDVFHNFFALRRERQTQESAVRLLKSLEMSEYLSPESLLKSAQNLREFLEEAYPGGNVFTEVPMTLCNERGQRLQGFIDMLVEMPNGWIVIDHKTGIPKDVQSSEAFFCQYTAQLEAYRQAVEAATGKPVLECIIHQPLLGEWYRVKAKS